jgi:NAD(P)-dependent dehydrogenase (short-subunit alcohol dehydrogenase family)
MNNDPFSLSGKLIIVTGASSGIGRQCAISCSQQGAKVVLFGRNEERLAETLKQMENDKLHLVCQIDLTEFGKVEDLIKDVVLKAGEIHGLVNCAGISTTLPFNLAKPEKLKEFFDTNVQAALNITRLVTRQSYFSKEGGSIIFISSVMGVTGEVGKSIYSMTKAAIIGVSKSLSVELATKKIRINCISPGVVETPMSKNAIYSRNEESLNKIRGLHPLGLGQPEDVANACIYLLSDASRWVTGTNLVVDGGYTAR